MTFPLENTSTLQLILIDFFFFYKYHYIIYRYLYIYIDMRRKFIVKGEGIMKRTYVRPMMVNEEFTANEYIAACGDSGVVYKFTCDAGYVEMTHEKTGFLTGPCGCGEYHGNNVPSGTYKAKASWYVTTGKNRTGSSLMNGYSSYSPCGSTHEAESDGVFKAGYMDRIGTNEYENIPVMTWAGERNNNIHCTTNLDMNSWETAKS